MSFKCGKCGKEFQSSTLRDSHTRQKCRKVYRLKLPDNTISVIHRCKEGFRCPVSTCSKTVTRGDTLRSHYKTAHAENSKQETSFVDALNGTFINPDMSQTPEILQEAGFSVVLHNELVLLVCLTCHFAMKHFTAKSIKTHVKNHGKVKRHQHGTLVVIPPLDKLSIALEELCFTPEDDTKLLPYTKDQKEELLLPIPGIPILDGFSCKKCVYYCQSPRTMSNHRVADHKHLHIREVMKNCKVQALYSGVGSTFYGVEEKNQYGTGDIDAQNIQELIMKKFLEDTESWQAEGVSLPVEEVAPWIRQCKWNEIALKFMPKKVPFLKIAAQLQPPLPSDKSPLSFLHIVISTYMQKLQSFLTEGDVEYLILRKVMRKNPMDDTNTGFNALFRQSSIKKYSEVMISFILGLLRSSSEETLVDHNYVIYTGRSDLKNALQELMTQLGELAEGAVEDVDITIIHQVLLLLWTPKRPRLLQAKKSSDCLFTRFLILKSLRKVGDDPNGTSYSFIHVSNVTQIFAKLQYWGRGVILMELIQELWHPSPEGLPEDTVEMLCTYVMDFAINTPFNTICQYMKLASSVAMSSATRANIAPSDDNQTSCSIEGEHITLSTFQDMISSIIQEAKSILDQEVLLGMKTDWIDNHLKKNGTIFDAVNTHELHYCFVSDKRNKIFQDHQKDLITHMFFSRMNGARFIKGTSREGEIIYNMDALQKWMTSCSKVEELLMLIIHFTAGLPARGEENRSFLLRNTRTGERSFFWYNGKVMIFQTYHKGANCGVPVKLNAHFLPRVLSPLFLKYLSIVRSVQVYIAEILWGKEYGVLYQDLWFLHMGKRLEGEDLSNSIRKYFQKYCGVRFGIRQYRHLAIYFADKLLRHQDEMADDILDESAGHTTLTASRHYAQSSKDKRTMDQHRMRGLECVAEMWHKLLNICQLPNVIPSQPPTIVLRHRDVEIDIQHINKKPKILLCPDTTWNIGGYDGKCNQETDPAQLISCDGAAKAKEALTSLKYKEWISAEQAISVALSIENVYNFVSILPTGGGKSLIFMAATTSTCKTIIVLVPLKALIRGHIVECEQAGITCSAYADGGIEIERPPAILFVSVETAAQSSQFIAFVKQLQFDGKLHSIVFDEIHLLLCDYRPLMKKVLHLIALDCQIIGLTASLPPPMQLEIEIALASKMHWVRCSTVRPNIRYTVVEAKEIDVEILSCLNTWMDTTTLKDIAFARAIIYCLTRTEVEQLAKKILAKKIPCTYIHSKLEDAEKTSSLLSWETGESKILVATSIIGCGYNYKHVKLVLHKGCIRSLADYHQESGRSGRDGSLATSCIVSNEQYRKKIQSSEELKRASGVNRTTDYSEISFQALKTAHKWIENRTVCRRFLLHSDMDGKAQMCNLMKNVNPCDVCCTEKNYSRIEAEMTSKLADTRDVTPTEKMNHEVYMEEEDDVTEEPDEGEEELEEMMCEGTTTPTEAAFIDEMVLQEVLFEAEGAVDGKVVSKMTTTPKPTLTGEAVFHRVSQVQQKLPEMAAHGEAQLRQVQTVHVQQAYTQRSVATGEETTRLPVRVNPAHISANFQLDKLELEFVRRFTLDKRVCLLCKTNGPKGDVFHKGNLKCPQLQNACVKCLDNSHRGFRCPNKFGSDYDTCHVCHFQHRVKKWNVKIHEGPYGAQCSDKSGEALRHFIWKAWRTENVQIKLWEMFPEIKNKNDKEFANWIHLVAQDTFLNNFVKIAAAIIRIKFPENR